MRLTIKSVNQILEPYGWYVYRNTEQRRFFKINDYVLVGDPSLWNVERSFSRLSYALNDAKSCMTEWFVRGQSCELCCSLEDAPTLRNPEKEETENPLLNDKKIQNELIGDVSNLFTDIPYVIVRDCFKKRWYDDQRLQANFISEIEMLETIEDFKRDFIEFLLYNPII